MVEAYSGFLFHYLSRSDTKVAGRMITMYIMVTLAVLFAFEAVPAWSSGDTVYAIIHTAPLIFPFFSLLGANIYSLLDWIERTETGADVQAQARLAEKRLQLEHERELERIKVEASAQAKVLKAERSTSVPRASHDTVPKDSVSSVPLESGDRQERILKHIEERGDTGPSDIAKQVQAGRSTVYRDLEEMEQAGLLIRVPSNKPRREYEYTVPDGHPAMHTNGQLQPMD